MKNIIACLLLLKIGVAFSQVSPVKIVWVDTFMHESIPQDDDLINSKGEFLLSDRLHSTCINLVTDPAIVEFTCPTVTAKKARLQQGAGNQRVDLDALKRNSDFIILSTYTRNNVMNEYAIKSKIQPKDRKELPLKTGTVTFKTFNGEIDFNKQSIKNLAFSIAEDIYRLIDKEDYKIQYTLIAPQFDFPPGEKFDWYKNHITEGLTELTVRDAQIRMEKPPSPAGGYDLFFQISVIPGREEFYVYTKLKKGSKPEWVDRTKLVMDDFAELEAFMKKVNDSIIQYFNQ